jgi:hypothetical protein
MTKGTKALYIGWLKYPDRVLERYGAKEGCSRLILAAVALGVIKRQPCEVCGKTPGQAHHADYNKPFVIRWLCQSHHSIHHWAEKRKKLNT